MDRWHQLVAHVGELYSIRCSDGEKVPYGLLVWSTGVGPSPLTQGLSCDKSKEGRVACDGWQRYFGPHRAC
jgi:NADH:ubiquinone reductase (non-electrogenic)